MEGRVFEMFLKNQKTLKIPKMPKFVPKRVQTCFEHVLGLLFEKKFCPVFHGGSSFRNVFKKFSKIQKCPKSFPKVSNYVLNMFWGYFFRKIFFAQCSMEGRDFGLRNVFKKSKNFQNFKKNQNRSQKCPNVFWTCFWVIFSKFFLAQCSMEGRVFEMFSKNRKFFKSPKMPKIVPKLSKRVLNMFWGIFFVNYFCPVFHGGSRLRNVFKKSKNFQKSKNAQNRSQKCPIVFWTCFGGSFFEKNFLPSVPWRVETSKCF